MLFNSVNITITKRAMTTAEADLLVDRVKRTPNIIGYSRQEWLSSKHTLIAEAVDGSLAGACLNYNVHRSWRKISALIVLENYRSQGVGKALFYKSCDEAILEKKNIYTISANPIVLKMMQDRDFEQFQNLTDLTLRHPSYGLLLYAHSIGWLLHCYRIQEVSRKFIYCRQSAPFFVGVKIMNSFGVA